MDFTVSENVYAGNAMNRRLFYQCGLLLPASPHGYVGQGLGQGVSAGAAGLMVPNRYVKEAIEEIEVDGVPMSGYRSGYRMRLGAYRNLSRWPDAAAFYLPSRKNFAVRSAAL